MESGQGAALTAVISGRERSDLRGRCGDFNLEAGRGDADYRGLIRVIGGLTMALQRYQLDTFTKGWFVGNFSPTLLATDAVEVAVKRYQPGESEGAHHHKVATELTLIVSGRARMNGEEIGPGEIIRIEPGEAADFTPLTEVTTVVVKLPCVRGDKYPGAAEAQA